MKVFFCIAERRRYGVLPYRTVFGEQSSAGLRHMGLLPGKGKRRLPGLFGISEMPAYCGDAAAPFGHAVQFERAAPAWDGRICSGSRKEIKKTPEKTGLFPRAFLFVRIKMIRNRRPTPPEAVAAPFRKMAVHRALLLCWKG